MRGETGSQHAVIKNSLACYVLSTCYASAIVSGGTDTPTALPALAKQTSECWANKQSQLITVSGAQEVRIEARDEES